MLPWMTSVGEKKKHLLVHCHSPPFLVPVSQTCSFHSLCVRLFLPIKWFHSPKFHVMQSTDGHLGWPPLLGPFCQSSGNGCLFPFYYGNRCTDQGFALARNSIFYKKSCSQELESLYNNISLSFSCFHTPVTSHMAMLLLKLLPGSLLQSPTENLKNTILFLQFF